MWSGTGTVHHRKIGLHGRGILIRCKPSLELMQPFSLSRKPRNIFRQGPVSVIAAVAHVGYAAQFVLLLGCACNTMSGYRQQKYSRHWISYRLNKPCRDTTRRPARCLCCRGNCKYNGRAKLARKQRRTTRTQSLPRSKEICI